MRKRHVPIFTSASDSTVPNLAVTLQSINDSGNNECIYDVRILTSGLAPYNQRRIRHMDLPALDVSIVNINDRVADYRADFEVRLGEFYTEESFYIFFIASMYPRIARALYVEPGTVFRTDAEELYRTDIGDAVLAGLVQQDEYDGAWRTYLDNWVGVDESKYVDVSAVLLDLTALRKNKIEDRFTRLLIGYNFDTVSPGGDYMNFLCKGRTADLGDVWDGDGVSCAVATFSPYRSPVRYVSMPGAEEFWDTARKTPFYEDIRDGYFAFNSTEAEKNERAVEARRVHAERLSSEKGGFYATLGENYLISKK